MPARFRPSSGAGSPFRPKAKTPSARRRWSRYLMDEIGPSVERLGFAWQLWPNSGHGRAADAVCRATRGCGRLPTVLIYGHGDVVAGYDAQWSDGRSPWQLQAIDGKWYGRGTADNKGQHTINLAALGRVLDATRTARIQRQAAARDGRGNRLAGPAQRRASSAPDA